MISVDIYLLLYAAQGNQELLVVRDKVGRTPGELGISKSMECDISPSVL